MSQSSLNLTCYLVSVTDPKGIMKPYAERCFDVTPQLAIAKVMGNMYVKFMSRRLGVVDVRIDLYSPVDLYA